MKPSDVEMLAELFWLSTVDSQMSSTASEKLFSTIVERAKKPSAGMLFFCPTDDTVFLTKRSSHMSSPGTWDVPGGRPEDDDDGPFETALREVYEEIGVSPNGKKPVKEHPIKTDRHHYIVYIFELTPKEKESINKRIQLSDETESTKWFKVDELPDHTHFDLTWIPDDLEDLRQ